MRRLFIADLHLDPARPATIDLFLRFLQEQATAADELYILGDLFEVWLGDDLIAPGYPEVLAAMKALAEGGTAVFVLHGNRDFLLGEGFEQASGARLIDEGTVLDIDGQATLLLHGDTLCSDDLPYQQLRQMLRNPTWIAGFLGKSAEERIAFAKEVRERSQKETGEKAETIMDVNAETVMEALRETGVRRLIHGHTHRPAVHSLEVDGETAERMVVGDWHESAEIIECSKGECRLLTYPAE